MKKMTVIENAVDIAVIGHMGLVDKGGKEALLHPLRVGLEIQKRGYRDELVAAGFLHDVVEDTVFTLENLVELDFPDETVEIVNLLTRDAGESYKDYIDSLYVSPGALIVKYFDSRDNLSRVSSLKSDDAESLENKYVESLAAIEKHMELNQDIFLSLKNTY